jgi:outer membrane protein
VHLKPALAAALLLASFTATAQPAARRPRVAVLEVRALGIAPEKAQLISEVALTEASNVEGLEVIGRSDIQSMIGFEKEKQMLGCSDDSKCMTEIAGALGVDWILVGSLGQLDALYRLDLKLIDAKRSKISGRIGDSIEGSQARLVSATQAGVHKLLDPIAKAAAASAAAAKSRPAPAPVSLVASPPSKGPAPKPVAAPVAEPPAEPVAESSSVNGAGLLSRLLVAVRLTGYRTGGDAWGVPANPIVAMGPVTVGMSEVVKSGGAVALDAAWKIGKGFAAGLYVERGRAGGGTCTGDANCSASLSRMGLEALWEEQPGGRFRWWGSLGAGYEWLDFESDVLKVTIKGPELANLAGGADFRLGDRFTVGPYLTASFGQYRSVKGTATPPGMTYTYPVDLDVTRKVHSWFGLGVRGTWGL